MLYLIAVVPEVLIYGVFVRKVLVLTINTYVSFIKSKDKSLRETNSRAAVYLLLGTGPAL